MTPGGGVDGRRAEVAEWFSAARAPSIGRIVDATDLELSPDARHLAFTAHVLIAADQDPRRRVAVFELGGPEPVLCADDSTETHSATWSPDGARLAWLRARADGGVAEISAVFRPGVAPVAEQVVATGEVEFVRWSPDGDRLLLGVAEPGAERSDVVGSGRLPETASRPDWAPDVDDGAAPRGWRRALTYALGSGELRTVSQSGLNVWLAEWCSSDALIAVASAGPSESDWYGAELVRLDLRSGRIRPLLPTDDQLAGPASSPSGARVSAIVGAMSDRGLDTGRLAIVAVESGTVEYVQPLGADVTEQRWLDEDRIVFAGLCGLRTVVGVYSVQDRTESALWQTDETCGGWAPAVTAAADTVVVCRHSYRRAPELIRLTVSGEQRLLGLDAGRPDAIGAVDPVHWAGADGTEIDGLLVTPPGPGPHPLIVHVHGGPVWAWRNSWWMHYAYTPLLVDHGYAVLHPNGRGSSGRGQAFVRDGLLDMGGLDADDLVRGVDTLAAAGLIDPERVGITGNSYGGFMAAWLAATSDRFAAANARSPVTDWVSQHFTSNLPGFDARCYGGDPLAADSQHRRRSPLAVVDQVDTPMLLMAGALDLATPPDQARMFHRALLERGRPSTLVIYPQEGHGVRRHDAVVDQCGRLLDFFERHVPVTPDRADLPDE
jgi:dipeptidyl aminopeptidase/acylaminoacyl peptidase